MFSSNSTNNNLLSLLTQIYKKITSKKTFIPNNKKTHYSKNTTYIYHKLNKNIYFPSSKTKYNNINY